MTNASTCGPLYRDALTAYTDMSPEQIRLFAAGFVTSAAEKIFLGTCPAAMFRPSPEHYAMLAEVVADTSRRYGLRYHRIRKVGELWLYHPNVEALIYQLHGLQENRDAWHALRGLLCGIPASQLDPTYHTRQGYGQPCDRPTEDWTE